MSIHVCIYIYAAPSMYVSPLYLYNPCPPPLHHNGNKIPLPLYTITTNTTTMTRTRLYYKIVCPPPGIKYFNDFNTYYPSPRYILLVSPLSLLSSYHASRLRRSTKPNLSQDNDISQQDVDTTNTTTTTGTRSYSCPHLYVQPTPPRQRKQDIFLSIPLYITTTTTTGTRFLSLSIYI